MQEEQDVTLYPVRTRKTHPIVKVIIFLITLQILFVLRPQEARTQRATDRDIPDMEQRLGEIETKLVANDEERKLLNDQLSAAIDEINKLKQEKELAEAKPRGFLSRLTGVFGYRKRGKLEKLMTESQDLTNRINELRKKREPLRSELVMLADELIDKSSSRMTALMDVVRKANLNDNIAMRNEAWKRLSALWQLAERTREMRNKYALSSLGPERTIAFPQLLSNNPEELRLGAVILKALAKAERTKASQLGEQIVDLQRKKLQLEQILELSKEIQRRDEERGAVGVGTTNIPWGSDVATKREIDDIEGEIKKLSAGKREFEANAERFESQSRILEQRASQIDTESKGKS